LRGGESDYPGEGEGEGDLGWKVPGGHPLKKKGGVFRKGGNSGKKGNYQT